MFFVCCFLIYLFFLTYSCFGQYYGQDVRKKPSSQLSVCVAGKLCSHFYHLYFINCGKPINTFEIVGTGGKSFHFVCFSVCWQHIMQRGSRSNWVLPLQVSHFLCIILCIYIYFCQIRCSFFIFFCARYQLVCFSWNELSVWFVCFGLCSVTCFSLFWATPDLSCLLLPLESGPFLWLQDSVYFPIAPIIQSTFFFIIGWEWNNYHFTVGGL